MLVNLPGNRHFEKTVTLSQKITNTISCTSKSEMCLPPLFPFFPTGILSVFGLNKFFACYHNHALQFVVFNCLGVSRIYRLLVDTHRFLSLNSICHFFQIYPWTFTGWNICSVSGSYFLYFTQLFVSMFITAATNSTFSGEDWDMHGE